MNTKTTARLKPRTLDRIGQPKTEYIVEGDGWVEWTTSSKFRQN